MSDRVQALRQSLERERERLRGIVEASPVGQVVTNRYGIVESCNGAASRLLADGDRPLTGRSVASFVALADRTQLRAAVNRAANGEQGSRLTARLADDPEVRMQFAVSPLTSAEKLRVVVRDVTGQVSAAARMERARRRLDRSADGGAEAEDVITTFALLSQERDQLRTLLDRLEQGVVAVDRRFRVEVANAAARELLGDALVEGRPLPEPWPDQVALRDLVQSLFARNALRAEARVVLPGDVAFEVEGLPAGHRGPNAILVITDSSRRERADRVEREFVANASHELRTPLATISGALEVLQSGAKEDPVTRDRFLAHIDREVERLSKLVRALLVLARAQVRSQAPRLSPVELRPVLTSASQAVVAPPAVDVVVACPRGVYVQADPDLLYEIVSNLAGNAASHTTEGKIVLFAIGRGARTVIEVRDTGAGMSDADQAQVFNRFYRPGGRDASRFGLGLAIVREAVAALDGTIEVESEPGKGTTMRVTLPSAEAAAA
jgi:two-component system phosphate regulon sensor histidine kinase PhoR